MSLNKIKYLQKLPIPKIRKRDGQLLEYSVNIRLTTDEAVLLSQFFQNVPPLSPKNSLIRTFLIALADETVNEETLLLKMAEMRTRGSLADKLSQSEVDRAM